MTTSSFKSFNKYLGWWLIKVSVLDRYIATELIGPFLFGVGAFASVGISIGTLFDLIRRVTEKGLPMGIAAEIFLLKLPDFLVLALPMSVLLGTLMAYSRLSGDSELVALRSCGVSVYRLVLPAVVLSFLVTGITFAFNEAIVPAANYRATLTLERALKREKPPFRDRNIIHTEFEKVKKPDGQKIKVMKRLFYAEQFDGAQMKGLTVMERSQNGLNQIVAAESAVWNVGENTWDFFNGTIYIVEPNGSLGKIVRFDRQQIQLPRTPLDLAKRGRDYGEMSIVQAKERLAIIRQGGNDDKIRELEVRIQQKYAFPFICVVFGLAGSTLGIRPTRASKATSFGISIAIIFGYYLLAFLTSALGQIAILSPFMAAWVPIMTGLGIGIFLLIRAAR
ncbi:MAG: YjgP/YjgQ family permease [Oscillatoria sp. SIO1A7]|nr:YjgP/YjgQ family permease [Oscillatoria sp. SIO1A7]